MSFLSVFGPFQKLISSLQHASHDLLKTLRTTLISNWSINFKMGTERMCQRQYTCTTMFNFKNMELIWQLTF